MSQIFNLANLTKKCKKKYIFLKNKKITKIKKFDDFFL